MEKKIFIFIATGLIVIGLAVGGYFFLVPRCPASCDDRNFCTQDSCSKETQYKCANVAIPDCCGNKICEIKEKYETCPADCPNCDDSNECTRDSYDYHQQKCANSPILTAVCCGNTVCETGETYQNCARDCPDCDDENKCTKDSYDYYERKCANKVIIPCCGNGICDKGAETRSNCSTDCPSCDDNNRLTSDSFNYTTQKCENIVTHYFIDDFESGSQKWDFLNAIDGGPNPAAWTLVLEGANTVLKGMGHNFADLSGKGWNDYILKFKFKKIKGSLNVNFRHHFFVSEEWNLMGRYIINLSGGNRISMQRALKEGPTGGDYTELGGESVAFSSGWHTLEIRGYRDILNVYFDGSIIIKYKDIQNPILSGKVSFETLDDEGGSEFLFDDVEIKVIKASDVIYP